jgi:adenylate kinase
MDCWRRQLRDEHHGREVGYVQQEIRSHQRMKQESSMATFSFREIPLMAGE